jgi:hypothetical protein
MTQLTNWFTKNWKSTRAPKRKWLEKAVSRGYIIIKQTHFVIQRDAGSLDFPRHYLANNCIVRLAVGQIGSWLFSESIHTSVKSALAFAVFTFVGAEHYINSTNTTARCSPEMAYFCQCIFVWRHEIWCEVPNRSPNLDLGEF